MCFVIKTLADCGFLTLQQCRAVVSGMGGFCVPNQFYNPQKFARGVRKRPELRASAMPYESLSVVRRVFGK